MQQILREADGNGKSTTLHGSSWIRYGVCAMVNFQFHMIAQIDDSTQVIIEHIHVHDEHGHPWKAILNWSNKIQDK